MTKPKEAKKQLYFVIGRLKGYLKILEAGTDQNEGDELIVELMQALIELKVLAF